MFSMYNKHKYGLMEFSKRIGGKPYLAVKFVGKRMDFHFLAVPESLMKSKGESYRVSYSDVMSTGLDFLTLINSA